MLFCFKKAYFCNFTKFLVVVLSQPTCPVHLYCTRQNRSTEGCSQLKRSVDMTSSGLNIRTNASPKWDRTRCPRCTVQVITLLISTAMWPSGIGVELFRSIHTEFLLLGFDTGMWHYFSWFSFSFIICASFWNAFCFNIIIQTFKLYITEWGDTCVHVFIKYIMVTLLWSLKYTNVYIYLCTVHILLW